MTDQYRNTLTAILAGLIMLSTTVVWLIGFIHSPIIKPVPPPVKTAAAPSTDPAPKDSQNSILAEAYWQRYPDVASHHYYGRNGVLGIDGARIHFEQHGKSAGRIFGPLFIPEDLQAESDLAEIYWHRYPAVAKSPTWGRKSSLGILGPRDHYLHIGKKGGRIWGPSSKKRQPQ